MEPTAGLPPHRHLALVGLMGVGKTSVGAAVAARSGRCHVDLDRAVTQLARRSIGVLFHEGGEAAFRAYAAEGLARAEERRAGKECRSRWPPHH